MLINERRPTYQRSPPGAGVLVTIVTTFKHACLDDPRVARCVTAELTYCEDRGWVESLAWVVMPDHVHWLLRLKEGSVAACVAVLKARSERAIQMAIGRPGRIWQAGYHEKSVRESERVFQTAQQIVTNPLRRGLVERVEHFPYYYTQWPDRAAGGALPTTASQRTHPP